MRVAQYNRMMRQAEQLEEEKQKRDNTMETRVVEQIKLYWLVMNPVTDRAESGRITMMSTDKNKLLERYRNEIVESYDDGHYRKVFRKDGPLEWYNPLWNEETKDTFGHGLYEDWCDRSNFNNVTSQYFFVQ